MAKQTINMVYIATKWLIMPYIKFYIMPNYL